MPKSKQDPKEVMEGDGVTEDTFIIEDSPAENEDDVIIPVTSAVAKCIFVSDGVYKYVDDKGNDIT